MVIETWNSQQSTVICTFKDPRVLMFQMSKFNFTIMALRALDGRRHF